MLPKCVYRSSDYKYFPRTHLSSTDADNENIGDILIKKYISAINHQMDYIEHTFMSLYGEHLNVKENMVGEIYITIRNIEKKTNLSLEKIGNEIKEYIECDINFIQEQVIRLESIAKAYDMMRQHKSISDIQNYLFPKQINKIASFDKSNEQVREDVEKFRSSDGILGF